MENRKELDVWSHLGEIYDKVRHGGVLVTSVGADGIPNAMTIGWWLFGPRYVQHPVSVIAIRPACHTFKLLDENPEYVIAVPKAGQEEAVALCGRESGRDMNKFEKTGLTPIESFHVKAPSIKECPINMECRIYHKERPPHLILTPKHREKPVEEQHTIYFSEILGVYAGG